MPGEKLGPFSAIIKVEGYIDSNNHLTNTAWGIHLETGQIEATSSLGMVVSLPLQRIRIRFTKQILNGDNVKILTYVTKGEDFIEFDQEMYRENVVVGSGLSRYGYSTLDMGKPIQQIITTTKTQLEEVFPLKRATLHPMSVLRSFERNREDFLASKGVDMKQEREEHSVRFLVASLDAKYTQALYAGQTVQIRDGFETYMPQFIFHQEMLKDGQIAVKAETRCALVDSEGNLIRSLAIINPIKNKLSSPNEEI